MPASSPSTDKKTEVSGFVLERTAKRMKQVCQRHLHTANLDLTVDQWVILQELARTNALSQYELGHRTFKDAPTVTRIIDLLCKKKLTERRIDPDDRRKFQIHLTEAGRRKIAEVIPTIRGFRQLAYENLSEDEMDQLNGLLNKIFTNLQ
jgi:DNA-binding MarR family transcriptional regulator